MNTPAIDLTFVDQLYSEELKHSLVEDGYLHQVKSFFASQEAADIAKIITEIPDCNSILLFRLLSRSIADKVFTFLDASQQNVLLESMAQEDVRRILTFLSPDDRTALFEELPAQVTQKLLSLLSENDRKEALMLLSYPEDSVGRMMTSKYVKVKPEWTIERALEQIRKMGTDSETIDRIYVVDDSNKLIDHISLRRIILANPQDLIKSLMDGIYSFLTSLQDREEAVHSFTKYDLFSLPVVDEDGVLLGIVTADDIIDVAVQEATEDFHKVSAIEPLTEEYLKTPVFSLVRRRVMWLCLLVVINIFSGLGIAHYEEVIESVVALVYFLPLLIDSAGNAGAQSATLVIRSMALGELKPTDYWKSLRKELFVSITLGAIMAGLLFVSITLGAIMAGLLFVSITLGAIMAGLVFVVAWIRAGVPVATVVSLSMISIVLFGSLTGLSLPFVLKKFNLDPAVASGPLVTSVADIFGVLIYLGLASVILEF
ncbi:hypothetical protein RCL1_007712 [Eukaryota sp. TZLM3-RCL]